MSQPPRCALHLPIMRLISRPDNPTLAPAINMQLCSPTVPRIPVSHARTCGPRMH